jgi:hypothetical protein
MTAILDVEYLLHAGQIIGEYTIDSAKDYQPKKTA